MPMRIQFDFIDLLLKWKKRQTADYGKGYDNEGFERFQETRKIAIPLNYSLGHIEAPRISAVAPSRRMVTLL